MRENIGVINKIQNYKNMPELIAEILKEDILKGILKGGVQLKQDDIAKKFNVSLIPVREALIQLESKGLVKSIRHKGAIVSILSLQEMQMIFELRKIIEAGAAEIIIERIQEEQLYKLHYILEKMEKESKIYIRNRHNKVFHQLLMDSTQNMQISETYENLFVQVERYLMYVFDCLFPVKNFHTHHHQIINCIEKKQARKLKNLLVAHIEDSQKYFIKEIEKNYHVYEMDWNDLLPFQTIME